MLLEEMMLQTMEMVESVTDAALLRGDREAVLSANVIRCALLCVDSGRSELAQAALLPIVQDAERTHEEDLAEAMGAGH